MRQLSTILVVVMLGVGCAPGTFEQPPSAVSATAAATTAEPAPDTSATTATTTGDTVPAPADLDPPCELGDTLDSVWQIIAGDGHGTAFHIGGGEWITAAHVVGAETDMQLRHGSRQLHATVVGIDHNTDVALMIADAPNVPALVMVETTPAVGEDVLAAGYPLYGESEPSVTRGVVSRLERDMFLGELVLTDTAVNPGNSGGPLLDRCGAVVGMVVQKIVGTEVEGVGYAVTAAELESQLPRLADGYGTEPPSSDDAPMVDAEALSLPVQWELLWTDEDLMTGEAIPYIVAWASEYDHGSDGFYGVPSLAVFCSGDWSLHWGGALAFGDIDGFIEADYRVGDGDVEWSLWFESSDYLVMTLWEFTDAATDMDVQARMAPDDATMAIRAWDWQNDLIGTAVFPLEDYTVRRLDLWRECP